MRLWKSIIATTLMWGSFLLSHELAYRVAYPDAAARAHELSHSGHGWLSSATHYGVPALAAILLVGLTVRGSGSTNRRAPWLALGAASLFAIVEILERALSAAMPGGHGFAINSTVMTVGIASALIFGSLVSGLYFTLQSFTLRKLYSFVPVYPGFNAPGISRLATFDEIRALFSSRYLATIPLRGPPALLQH